jgi:hypothetical protein
MSDIETNAPETHTFGTVFTDDPMKAEPGAPTDIGPQAGNPANAGIATEEAQPQAEPALVDQATDNAPVDVDAPVDTNGGAFARFRMHWRGGERRLALALVEAGEFAEREYAALLGEFPEIIEAINAR